MLLNDRINYIYNNDDTQCQSNCKFFYYSIESQYMQCSCSINEVTNNNILKNDKFSSKKLYESFYDVLKYSNYNILKCYKIIYNINIIKSNIGSIIVIINFCFYLICLIIYLYKGINPLKMKLIISLEKEKVKITKFKIKSILFHPPYKKNSKLQLNIKYYKKNKTFKKLGLSSQRNIYNKPEIYSNSNSKRYIFKKNNLYKSKYFNYNKSLNFKYNNKVSAKNDKIEYSDYELNNLEYEDALKFDKRSLFLIYWAILKREHLIIFTFCTCNDYNLVSVKLARFIFLIIGDMALNTFFFSDDSMHKLFLNYGKYNFIQQIPQITYSVAISSFIEIFLCYLSLTDKYFYLLKSIFVKGDKNNIRKIIKYLKIKLIIFYILECTFLIIYWYIISVFCGIYRNTQITFIKDSLISFSICLAYPFALYFISSCLRYCSLRNKKRRWKNLYKFSYIFPFF